jgi:hypothetical protein
MTRQEKARWRAQAEADGWRPAEVCECRQPKPGYGGGNLYYITSVCLSCQRQLRKEQE